MLVFIKICLLILVMVKFRNSCHIIFSDTVLTIFSHCIINDGYALLLRY